jgi:hypothetical protein
MTFEAPVGRANGAARSRHRARLGRAAGWARHGNSDEKMAQSLEAAERQREPGR